MRVVRVRVATLGLLVSALLTGCEDPSRPASAVSGTSPGPRSLRGVAVPKVLPRRYDPPRTPIYREFDHQGFHVRLDLASQALRLSLPEDLDFEATAAQEAPLRPTPLSTGVPNPFVSGSMLVQKAKLFDDGLMAAVELAAQEGRGTLGGKGAMLTAVARGVVRRLDGDDVEGNVPDLILAACQLGGLPVEVPGRFAGRVKAQLDRFRADPRLAQPLGIYTWSEALGAIFRQDRQLQSELIGHEGVDALARSLHADPAARKTYEAYLELVEALTNPFDEQTVDLRPALEALDRGRFGAPARGTVFLPASRSHESDLVRLLFRTEPVPEGFSLADELIRRIRERRIGLDPTPRSGWYDYQTWALEPLARPERTPEAQALAFDEPYREQLVALFKGALALARETHIKQLPAPPAPGDAPSEPAVEIPIAPFLTAEPLATYYRRRAISYQFLHAVLEHAFGPEGLASIHRWTPDGPVEADLGTELDRMLALHHGAYLTAMDELGLPSRPLGDRDPTADAGAFRTWAAGLASDPDLGRDVRMMVPVFLDVPRGLTRVWAVLGWAERPLAIDFVRPPEATVTRDDRPADPNSYRLAHHVTTVTLVYPVTAEVYVDAVLDRDTFRALCDRARTRSAILAELRPTAVPTAIPSDP